MHCEFQHSTKEAEADISVSSRPTWPKEQVLEQPGLYQDTALKNQRERDVAVFLPSSQEA